MRRKDYSSHINTKHGSLTIKSIERIQKKVVATCLCDCGNITTRTNLNRLLNGKIKQCKSCSSRLNGAIGNKVASEKSKYNSLIGTKVHYFTVLRRAIDNEPCGTFKCQCVCGNIRFLDAYDLCRTTDRKSCGCKQSYLLSLANGGTGIPNEGISTNEFIRKNTSEYSAWVKLCLEKANYTCAISGIQGHTLNVHHIVPLNQLIKEHNITKENYLNYSRILFDTTNAVVLSETLHKEFHKIYGNLTTREQLEEFKATLFQVA
jgi:hypothetical protein